MIPLKSASKFPMTSLKSNLYINFNTSSTLLESYLKQKQCVSNNFSTPSRKNSYKNKPITKLFNTASCLSRPKKKDEDNPWEDILGRQLWNTEQN